MKATLKLRDDEKKPLLLKAKIPLTIGGLPFFSAVSGGASSSDLQLDLGTAFSSVPSARLSYRPNDAINPFLLSLRSGALASHSTLSFHVDFNPLRGGSPSFSLHIKPRLGDFSLRKLITSSSPFHSPADTDDSRFASAVKRTFDGVEVQARSVLPLVSGGGASVNFRWGVRVSPTEIRGAFADKRPAINNVLPLLAMNKISVQYTRPEEKTAAEKKKKNLEEERLPENLSVLVRKQMDALKIENALLRKAVDDLRVKVIGEEKTSAGESRGLDARKVGIATRGAPANSAVKGGGRNEKKESAATNQGNLELRKAIMEAAAASSSSGS